RINFRCGRQHRLDSYQRRIDLLQGEHHVNIPVEEQVDLSRAAAGNRAHRDQPRDAVDGFFDGTRDGDNHLVNRHDAVVDADDDAGKINLREHRDWNFECQIAAHDGESNDQEYD